MCNFKIIGLLIILQNALTILTEPTPKHMCGNPECTKPIAKAKTQSGYPQRYAIELSFEANMDVILYSKDAGQSKNFGLAEVNGKRGYVPLRLIKESQVLVKRDDLLEVDCDYPPKVTIASNADNKIKPDQVKETYEVVDGTTIYNDAVKKADFEDAGNVQEVQQEVKEVLIEKPVEESVENAVNTTTPDLHLTASNPVENGSVESVIKTDAPKVENEQPPLNPVTEDSKNTVNVNNVTDTPIQQEINAEAKISVDAILSITENDTLTKDTNTKVPKIAEDNKEIILETTTTEIPVDLNIIETLSSKFISEEVRTESKEPTVAEIIPSSEKPETVEVSEPKIVDEKPIEVPVNSTPETVSELNESSSDAGDGMNATDNIPLEVTTLPTLNDDNLYDNILEEVTDDPLKTIDSLNIVENATENNKVEVESSEQIKRIENDENIEVEEEENNSQEDGESGEDSVEETQTNIDSDSSPGIFSKIVSYFNPDTEANLNDSSEDLNASNEEVTNEVAKEIIEDTQNLIQEHTLENFNVNEELTETTNNSADEFIKYASDTPQEAENLITNQNLDMDPSDDCQEEDYEKMYETFSNFLPKDFDFFEVNIEFIATLIVSAATILVFLLGYFCIDKTRKESPLVAKINKLEKQLMVAMKENETLRDNISEIPQEEYEETVSKEELEKLETELITERTMRTALEEQIQTLEKELENSTEVGLELNRMLTEILSSQNGSDKLIANVEQLQRQLIEQQETINTVNETLNEKNTEIHEITLELEISNKKVVELQSEVDKLVLNLLKVEEEKEQQQSTLETTLSDLKSELQRLTETTKSELTQLQNENQLLKSQLADTHKQLEMKTNEFDYLKESVNEGGAIGNDSLNSLLDFNVMRAELAQLRKENSTISERIKQTQESKREFERQAEASIQEAQKLRERLDEVDKEKLKAQTELHVLSNYFKEKEADLQKKLSKHESLWSEKQGETASTIERIKFMQEELQNYKAQNESLKKEIVAQEVELKSQISLLEKKVHDNWVMARQAERRLEDAKQEAAQLRNRLTLRERAYSEDKHVNRIQSPVGQNGDLLPSPLHLPPVDTPASPPLLYGTRDHMTTSPPMPMPPFLPPPPGVPFMPPPLPGVPPFMPPPMFPGDHRPPPLGRMSSPPPPPPLNSRYSPDSRAYSPYDRNSPSPPYDSEYGAPSPPLHMHRGYSPFNSKDDGRIRERDGKKAPPVRSNANRNQGSTISSGSENSNESLEKISKHSRGKV